MLEEHFVIKLIYPEAGAIGDSYVTILDDLSLSTLYDLLPPRNVERMEFECYEVLPGSCCHVR